MNSFFLLSDCGPQTYILSKKYVPPASPSPAPRPWPEPSADPALRAGAARTLSSLRSCLSSFWDPLEALLCSVPCKQPALSQGALSSRKQVIQLERPSPQAASASPRTPAPGLLATPRACSPRNDQHRGHTVSVRDLLGRKVTLSVPNGPTCLFRLFCEALSRKCQSSCVFENGHACACFFLKCIFSASASASCMCERVRGCGRVPSPGELRRGLGWKRREPLEAAMAGRGAAGNPLLDTGGAGCIPGGTREQLWVLVWNQKHSEMLATHRQDGSDAKDGDRGALGCQTRSPGPFPHHTHMLAGRCTAGSSPGGGKGTGTNIHGSFV